MPTSTQQDPSVVDGTAVDVVPARDNPASIYTELDRQDEEIVVRQIAGEMVETMAYEFQMDGKPQRGLSIVGVSEATRAYTEQRNVQVDVSMPVFRKTTDGEGEPVYECDVKAVALRNGVQINANLGTAEQRIFPKKKNGEVYFDPMARRKALSKAQRNAKLRLLPVELVTTMLQAVELKKVKKVQTYRALLEEQAPAKAQDRQSRTKAEKPKPQRQNPGELPLTGGQLRGLYATAKENGIPNDADPRWKAIIGYFGHSLHADRITRKYRDDVDERLKDPDGAIAFISDRAGDGDERAQWLVTNVLAAADGGDGAAQTSMADATA